MDIALITEHSDVYSKAVELALQFDTNVTLNGDGYPMEHLNWNDFFVGWFYGTVGDLDVAVVLADALIEEMWEARW